MDTDKLKNIRSSLESSYIPTLFETKEQNKLTISGDYIWSPQVAGALMPGFIAGRDLYMGASLSMYNDFGTKLLENGVNALKWLFGTPKRIEEFREQLERLNQAGQTAYDNYVSAHEKTLAELQVEVEKINKNKDKLKQRALPTLAEQLDKIGISCEFGEYRHDYLDMRDFPIHEEFNAAKETFKTSCADINFLVGMLVVAPKPYMVFRLLKNFSNYKKLSKKTFELKEKCELSQKMMDSDVQKLLDMGVVLRNIANIYRDMVSVFIPIIEDFARDLERKYQYDIKNIPSELLRNMANLCGMVSDICSKTIVSSSKRVDDLKNSSNDLSIKYTELRNAVKENLDRA